MTEETLQKAKYLQEQIKMLESFFNRYDTRLPKASEVDVTIHAILREEVPLIDEEIPLKDMDYCVIDEVMDFLRNTLDKLKKEFEELWINIKKRSIT